MKLLERVRGIFERRSVTLRDADGWRDWLGTRTSSGVAVTPETALGHPAVLGAVRLLAELVASLPLVTYERTSGGRRRAEGHPVYHLLHEAPNDIMTPFTWKETFVMHLLLHGDAYNLIDWDGIHPAALWPLHPTRTSLDDAGGTFAYKGSTSSGPREYSPRDVVHVPILAADGMRGQSPIMLAREAIGAALASEEHAALYFGNSAQPSVVLTHPGHLSDEGASRLKETWNSWFRSGGRHGTAILEEGMKAEAVSGSAQEAQLIEARQFAMRLVAAAMRIPPHLLDPSTRSTYANVETQSIELLTFTLQPLLTRIEEALSRKLFSPKERSRYYVEFLVDGLLRSDTRTRYA